MKIRLYKRRNVRMPTLWGWILIFGVFGLIAISVAKYIPTYLSPNEPVQSKILVVEGWLPDFAMKRALKEFYKGKYQFIITTGVKIPNGTYLAEYPTNAELGRAVLIRYGLDSNLVFSAPAPDVYLDRTYTSALALKKWFTQKGLKPANFNLYSMGAHTMRSWYLFRLAFKDWNTEVGIINTPDLSYNAKHWWKSSKGLRTIPSEALGFFFVYFFFYP